MPPMQKEVGVEDRFDRCLGNPWQRRAFDKSVDVAEAFDRLFDSRIREIRTPEDLIAVVDRVL